MLTTQEHGGITGRGTTLSAHADPRRLRDLAARRRRPGQPCARGGRRARRARARGRGGDDGLGRAGPARVPDPVGLPQPAARGQARACRLADPLGRPPGGRGLLDRDAGTERRRLAARAHAARAPADGRPGVRAGAPARVDPLVAGRLPARGRPEGRAAPVDARPLDRAGGPRPLPLGGAPRRGGRLGRGPGEDRGAPARARRARPRRAARAARAPRLPGDDARLCRAPRPAEGGRRRRARGGGGRRRVARRRRRRREQARAGGARPRARDRRAGALRRRPTARDRAPAPEGGRCHAPVVGLGELRARRRRVACARDAGDLDRRRRRLRAGRGRAERPARRARRPGRAGGGDRPLHREHRAAGAPARRGRAVGEALHPGGRLRRAGADPVRTAVRV